MGEALYAFNGASLNPQRTDGLELASFSCLFVTVRTTTRHRMDHRGGGMQHSRPNIVAKERIKFAAMDTIE